tara:strand:+ start:655 stop:861 length:207 start_codon:yes stop_codon:yes gene_type:complete
MICKKCEDNIGLTDVQGYYSGVCKDCRKRIYEETEQELRDIESGDNGLFGGSLEDWNKLSDEERLKYD